MSRTVTAFFDSRPEAEAAKERLQSSDIDADRIRIVDQSSSDESGGMSAGSASSSSGTGESKGFFASLADMFMPDEDAFAYQEGINRGGFLLCAQVDEQDADRAVQLLEESDSVDFDSREQDWRSQGWAGYAKGSATDDQQQRQQPTGQQPTGQQPTGQRLQGMGATGVNESESTMDEERIPIVEEELRVGKREVSRGGAKVRSYVREAPVHEQVRLHEEHVSVERRPVDQTLSAAELDNGDMLRDRTIEMTETAEEAVIGKEARVREELVVRKTGGDRVEQVDDTVRHTEVEVDENFRGSEDRSAFSGLTGDRDRDGTPNALDSRDRTGSGQGGLTGDRDGDGMPNALDTTDRNRR